ncbi:GumC family protein [Chthonobacter albigriseus]|uniref:GumC family protein n=1 Tax=Chthonobacter albigriseus TaxID=1683161 RepID=UPI001FCE6D7B|nr:exopolysaccharide transport family protein [Chthonobacter albigriseus]
MTMTMTPITDRFREDDLPSRSLPAASDDGGVEIQDLWRILWHRRMWVVVTVVLFAGLAVLYSLVTPPLYSATAQLLVDPRDRQIVNNALNPSMIASDGGITQVESQVSVLQSSGVLLRAIQETRLTEDEEFNGTSLIGEMTSLVAGMLGRQESVPNLTSVEVKTLANLRRRLAVKRADKVFVIEVTTTAKSPDKAARIANAITAAYLADQGEARSRAAREASEALTARLEDQRRAVEAAENAVETYRSENNLVMASGQLVSERQLADVNEQLSAAQNRVATLKAQIDQIEQQAAAGTASGATSEAMQSAVVAKLREQESTLAQREADLSSRLGPRHPSLIAVRTQLEQVRRSVTGELERVALSARADYDRAVANEQQLAAKLESLKQQSLAVDQTSVRLRELQRDLDAVKSVYSAFLVRAQEAREQANVNSTNVRVIGEALPPNQKSWPRLSLLLVGAIGAGVGIGAGLAFLREFGSPSLLSIGQAEAIAQAPVLGVLPKVRSERARRSASADNAAGLVLARIGDRASGAPSTDTLRTILLTSGRRDEPQRHQVAAQIASASSVRGDRVLLIDANAAGGRHGSQPGLLDILRGESGVMDAIRINGGAGFAVMPLGRASGPIMDRIARVQARRILTEAGVHFDLVLVDGGAASDNIALAPLADALDDILVVAELGTSAQRDVKGAVRTISLIGRSVTGVVLIGSGDTH